MTSLSRKRDLTLEIPDSLPTTSQKQEFLQKFDDDTTEADIVEIKIGDRLVPFTKKHLEKYPKLRDPNVRFLLEPLDPWLAIIYGYPC